MPSRYAVTQSHLVRGLGKLAVPSWMPPITKNLLFNVPRHLNANAIWNNGALGVQAPDTQSIDAVGRFDHARTRLITPALANILRIEKDGGVAEAERINLVYPSSDFSDARWAKTNAAVDADAQVLPDGTTGTVNELRATAANGMIIQDLGVIASAIKTFAIWLKRKTGSGDIDITLDGGATWTTVAVTTTWTRFDKAQTLADPDVGVRIVTSGDEVIAWQGQAEDSASVPSRDIPTTTGPVTRAKDLLVHPASGNIPSSQPLSVVIGITPGFDSTDAVIGGSIFDSSNAANNWGVQIFRSAGLRWECRVRDATGSQARLFSYAPFSRGDLVVLIATIETDSMKLYDNGVLQATDLSGSVPSSHQRIAIGANRLDGVSFIGNIAPVWIYAGVLSATEVIILTSAVRTQAGVR